MLKRWALPQEELLTLPGYRVGTQERQEDEQEARRLYEAAGSPDLFITFGDQPGYVPQFAPQYKRKLEEVLGAKVDYQVRAYAIINEGNARGEMPFTWRYDNGWIDLDDWVYPHFHSGSSANVCPCVGSPVGLAAGRSTGGLRLQRTAAARLPDPALPAGERACLV